MHHAANKKTDIYSVTPTSRQVVGRQEKDAKVGKSNDVMPVIIVGNCSELPVS